MGACFSYCCGCLNQGNKAQEYSTFENVRNTHSLSHSLTGSSNLRVVLMSNRIF